LMTYAANGSEFDIFDLWLPLSLDGIVHSVTGFDKNIQLDDQHDFMGTFKK
jgi:hypothetical protein